MNSLQLRDKDTIRVESEYNSALVVAFREIKAMAWSRYKKSAGWDSKAWNFPLECYPEVKQAMMVAGEFELDPAATSAYNKLLQAKEQAEKAVSDHESRAASLRQQALKRLHLKRPLADGRVLFPHQQEAVKVLTQTGSMILGDQQGLGKTIEALAAAEAFQLPIYVICPASLKSNWQIEADNAGIAVAAIYSWAKIPAEIKGDYVLILDEAHMMQSLTSRRTKAAMKLCLALNCMAAYLLTGTPMKNGQPQHLYPLLKAIKHPIAKDKNHYDIHFCDATSTRFTRWDTSGAKHLDELHHLIKDKMLRRTKDEVLDLPPKIKSLRVIDLTDNEQAEYKQRREAIITKYLRNSAERNFKSRMAHDLLEGYSEDDLQEAIKDMSEDDLIALSILMADRQAASHMKVEAAVELGEEVLEQNGQIVFFTMFKDTAERIAQRFDADAALFIGDTKLADRQARVDAFQAGRLKVLVCTFGAGGVGITLTAAQTVVLVDRPWTPGDAEQSADRLHRIGQKGTVYVTWLQCDETDRKIDALLSAKQTRIDKVLIGEAKTMSRLRGVDGDIVKIAREVAEQMKLEMPS